jgi:hypothetical protein
MRTITTMTITGAAAVALIVPSAAPAARGGVYEPFVTDFTAHAYKQEVAPGRSDLVRKQHSRAHTVVYEPFVTDFTAHAYRKDVVPGGTSVVRKEHSRASGIAAPDAVRDGAASRVTRTQAAVVGALIAASLAGLSAEVARRRRSIRRRRLA